MKCTECGHDAPMADFRYLYNARIDASVSIRQCTSCGEQLAVDELKGDAVQTLVNGVAPWGKSTGIEGLAEDVTGQATA